MGLNHFRKRLTTFQVSEFHEEIGDNWRKTNPLRVFHILFS